MVDRANLLQFADWLATYEPLYVGIAQRRHIWLAAVLEYKQAVDDNRIPHLLLMGFCFGLLGGLHSNTRKKQII